MFAITITVSWIIIPIILSILFLNVMLTPYKSRGDYDFGSIFKLFWLIPIMFVWMVYMGIMLIFK